MDDVISDGSAVPARLRAALFGDVTLEQLATMAGQSEDETSPAGQVASMATNVLVRLFTDPARTRARKIRRHVEEVRLRRQAVTKASSDRVRRSFEDFAHVVRKASALATMYLPGAR